MIKTVIFDIGNVVWRYQDKLDQLKQKWADICHTSLSDFHHIYSQYYKTMETGENTLDDFVGSINQSSNLQLFKQAVDEIYLSPDFDSYLIPGTLDIIGQLRQKFSVGYLSNAENYLYPYIQQRMEQYFDFGYCSWQLGIRKPDPEIFTKVLSLHHLQAPQTIFVDDVEKNIIGAKSVGLNAIHFLNPPQLLSELQQLNILT